MRPPAHCGCSGSPQLPGPELSGQSRRTPLLQKRFQQKARAPKALAWASVGAISSSATEPCGTTPHSARRQQLSPPLGPEALSSTAACAGEGVINASAEGSALNAAALPSGGDAPAPSLRRPDGEHHSNGTCVSGGHAHEATTKRLIRKELRSSDAGSVVPTARDWVGKGRRVEVEGDGATPLGKVPPTKKPRPGEPFGASKSRSWHAQQRVQSAATPTQVWIRYSF